MSSKIADQIARKQARIAAKLQKQAEKLAAKQQNAILRAARKQEKIKEKEVIKAVVARERQKMKATFEKKIKKTYHKHEVQSESLKNIIQVARRTQEMYPEGFTTKQITQKYIELHGRKNPYTLEDVDDKYDLHAGIRGLMYETSPSSEQHWFRYGIQKVREQVAPWIFANKKLAIVNNQFGWKVSTPEMSVARRQNKGLWTYMIDGSHAFYDWSEEKYGPLPTEEVLTEAAKNRRIGVRGSKKILEQQLN